MTDFNSKPLFSIIIPTYNHAHLICRCIDSIISQTYPNWEAIVINNYSEDNTIELVNSYQDPRIRLINFRNNGVISASRNIGIRNSSADWICFLDSDDWWYPKKLEICISYLDNYSLIYHDLDVYSARQPKSNRTLGSWSLKADVFIDLMIRGNALNNSSVIVKKELLLKVDCFSEDRDLIFVEDYDCWLKISLLDNKFCFIPQSLGGYWMGNNSSAASKKTIKRMEFIFNKFQNKLNDTDRAQALSNLNFTNGLLYYTIKDYTNAIACFKKAWSRKTFSENISVLSLL